MINTFVLLIVFLLAILLVPRVCRKIHIPSIVGFILVGIVLGPSVLAWTRDNSVLNLIGQMGMLYIMFQAGIEIDMNDFRQQRNHALLFGFYTFLFPFVLGLITSRLLGLAWNTSILLGAMYGSHTLMTYPIVSRYGIQKTPVVNIVVGGTMVAITLSLFILTAVESHAHPQGNIWLSMGKIIFGLTCVLWLFPHMAQYVFKRWQDESSQFLLVMAMLITSAVLAEWAGLVGILGAFLCGVALNGRVPNRSKLMGHINFIGSTLFVPIFLMSVGLMVDIHTFRAGWWILLIAVVMIGTKLAGKWLASWVGQLSFRLSQLDRELMFGLTHATAAGTLAIVTVGYQNGFFQAEILNGSIIMILVLCTISSFVTEHAAKELALQEDAKLENERDCDEWSLISIGRTNENALEQLGTFSQLFHTKHIECADGEEAHQWAERNSTSTIIYNEKQPLNTISRLVIAVPRYAEKEHDFISCFGLIRRLSGQIGTKVIFFANKETQDVLKAFSKRPGKFLRASYHEIEDWEDVLLMAKETRENDLVIFISARQSTPSYNPLFEQLPSMVTRFFANNSQLIIYPEQNTDSSNMDIILSDIPQASSTWRIVTYIKKQITKLVQYIQFRN
ncbi:MAG: cation:proton antiporter [Paludibacteraceae bacterium]|nr:cation:proton antiporter [Paludibacteraceae bacterium]